MTIGAGKQVPKNVRRESIFERKTTDETPTVSIKTPIRGLLIKKRGGAARRTCVVAVVARRTCQKKNRWWFLLHSALLVGFARLLFGLI